VYGVVNGVVNTKSINLSQSKIDFLKVIFQKNSIAL